MGVATDGRVPLDLVSSPKSYEKNNEICSKEEEAIVVTEEEDRAWMSDMVFVKELQDEITSLRDQVLYVKQRGSPSMILYILNRSPTRKKEEKA